MVRGERSGKNATLASEDVITWILKHWTCTPQRPLTPKRLNVEEHAGT